MSNYDLFVVKISSFLNYEQIAGSYAVIISFRSHYMPTDKNIYFFGASKL